VCAFCLLGEPEDLDLIRLARALQQREQRVELVLPEELLLGSALTYRIDGHSSWSSLRLQDGRTILSDPPVLVVNRLSELPQIAGPVNPPDAGYLAQEWRAVIAAWLRTLACPVLNPPRASFLHGPQLSAIMWRRVASAHGIPVSSCNPEAVRHPITVIWVGNRLVDPAQALPDILTHPIAELSRFLGAPLLELSFDRRGDEWQFVRASTRPAFARASNQVVEALVELAREKSVVPS